MAEKDYYLHATKVTAAPERMMLLLHHDISPVEAYTGS